MDIKVSELSLSHGFNTYRSQLSHGFSARRLFNVIVRQMAVQRGLLALDAFLSGSLLTLEVCGSHGVEFLLI